MGQCAGRHSASRQHSGHFTSWSRRDLSNFIRGLEEHGRDDLRRVAKYVDGKTDKEVRTYAAAFFKQHTQIKDWQKLMRRIEAGEQRIVRQQELDVALTKKVRTGSGLPAGPYGLLGAAEGLAYIAIVAGLVVLGFQFSDYGYLPNAVPVQGGVCK